MLYAFAVVTCAAKVDQVKFDVTQLHARPELAAEQRMADDASGKVEVRSTFQTTFSPAGSSSWGISKQTAI